MTKFQPALVHTPVTPFTRENRINFDLLEKLIEFHLSNGAEALALPTPWVNRSVLAIKSSGLFSSLIKQVKGAFLS
jgi:hypothetical protein